MSAGERYMVYPFAGGVHPPEHKDLTASATIAVMPPPATVVIPLQQHIGAPCKATVKVGDRVRRGQPLGEPGGFVSAPVHASISGTVKAIEPRPHPLGGEVPAVVIESDGEDAEVGGDAGRRVDYTSLKPDQIRELVRAAGIVGMGGAAFPTHVKLTPPEGATVEQVVLNGAECEPYLTSDHRVMLERSGDVVEGLRILMYVLGAKRGVIAVEDNKADAIELLSSRVKDDVAVKVLPLHVKYPQGAELQLIKAVTDREVAPGKLPVSEGIVVQNVGTAVAVVEAVVRGRPLYERVVTVTGEAVARPRNVLVRVGTSFREVIDFCGGFGVPPGKVLAGGPMMGMAVKDLSVPVVKSTSGILCLPAGQVDETAYGACIKCKRCVDACPMGIVAALAGTAVEADAMGLAEQWRVMDCKECGCCGYVCPARRPLVHWFKYAKARITAARRSQKKA